jgi:hypothetical protein
MKVSPIFINISECKMIWYVVEFSYILCISRNYFNFHEFDG